MVKKQLNEKGVGIWLIIFAIHVEYSIPKMKKHLLVGKFVMKKDNM
ncbi:metallo-beta-lactamase [Bacillus cereus ATCC 4342]|nr:metallo-beta-lactamase [Bacillus cereus ATCC 4342]